MYAALRAVHLLRDDKTVGETAEPGMGALFSNLDSPVSEYGQVRPTSYCPLICATDVLLPTQNLSSGERQLLCLARALLKRHKIVILDEATSSVDYATDKLITQTIEEEFKGVTMLTIGKHLASRARNPPDCPVSASRSNTLFSAHRLRTIIGYDRVLVMSQGKLVEQGRPLDLMRDTQSRFHALGNAVGCSTLLPRWG